MGGEKKRGAAAEPKEERPPQKHLISVVARLRIKSGQMPEAVSSILGLMNHVAEEKGVLRYTLNRDRKDPAVLVLMEQYQDMATLRIHGQTPHLKAFFVKAGDFLDGPPEVFVLEEIATLPKPAAKPDASTP
jgi:quinol monooxygenase YgiN